MSRTDLFLSSSQPAATVTQLLTPNPKAGGLLLTFPFAHNPKQWATKAFWLYISLQCISLLTAFAQTRLTSISPLCILHHDNIPLYKRSYMNSIIPLPVPTVFVSFSETVSHILGQPRTCHVAENDIELLIFLPLPPQVSGYMHHHTWILGGGVSH